MNLLFDLFYHLLLLTIIIIIITYCYYYYHYYYHYYYYFYHYYYYHYLFIYLFIMCVYLPRGTGPGGGRASVPLGVCSCCLRKTDTLILRSCTKESRARRAVHTSPADMPTYVWQGGKGKREWQGKEGKGGVLGEGRRCFFFFFFFFFFNPWRR